MKNALKGTTAINQHIHVEMGPLKVTITPAELKSLDKITFDNIKALLIEKGHPPERLNGKFSADATEAGLEIEFL